MAAAIPQFAASTFYQTFSNSPLIPFTYASVTSYIMVLLFEVFLYRPDVVDGPNRISEGTPFELLRNSYDFIVIGAGSAGSIVASRLSENPEWQVLLLEAGMGEPVAAEIPFITPTLGRIPHIDWNFYTEPLENCALSQNHHIKWSRGKVVGGSGILNTVAYVRGSKKDFDRWRDLGNAGWGYNEVLPYFKKSEDIRIPSLRHSPYHGRGGYLSIEHFSVQSPITDVAVEAARQLGIYNEDVNGVTQVGFTRTQANIRDGLRDSSAKAFLRPAKRRPNLHISIHSRATRVLINPVTKVAEGVEFLKNNSGLQIYKTVHARREVIVCAGSVQSPHVLMVSGVGPADHLTEHGVRPIVDLPGVGQNLQDHVAVGGVTYVINANTEIGPLGVSARMPRYMTNLARTLFTHFRTGPLYSLPRSEGNLFANSKYNTDPDWPDIQVVIIPTGTNCDGGLFDRVGNGITDEVYKRVYGPYLDKYSMAISPVFSRPFSRGSIRLRDGNPLSYPKIYAPYYTDPRDMKYMIEACNIGHRFVQAPAFKKFNLTLIPNRFPGCEEFIPLSDQYWECQARHWTSTFWHASGTCKMSPKSDPMAVVDARLRVHGVPNLRVIDASIMPYITSGNTNAPTMMIGEKGAQMVIEDWIGKPPPLA